MADKDKRTGLRTLRSLKDLFPREALPVALPPDEDLPPDGIQLGDKGLRELDRFPNPKAVIPGVEEGDHKRHLADSTSFGHVRGRNASGDLTIDGVPVEASNFGLPESEQPIPTQPRKQEINPELAAKNERALRDSLRVAGYSDADLTTIGLNTDGRDGADDDAPESERIKPPRFRRSHHTDKSRPSAQAMIKASRTEKSGSPSK